MEKEDMRNSFLLQLSKAQFPNELLQTALNCFDSAVAGYSVQRETTDIILANDKLGELLKIYMAIKASEGLAKGSLRNMMYAYKMFHDTIGKQLEQITINDIRVWQFNYQQSRKVSNETMNCVMQRICSFFSWAYTEDYIPKDITKTWKRMKTAKRQKHALKPLDLQKIFQSAEKKGAMYLCIVTLLYSTGCRISEMSHIKPDDINFADNSIKVIGKGNKERTVYINTRANIALHAWLDDKTRRKGAYLFNGYKNRQMSTKRLQMFVDEVVADTDITMRITPHTFRHTTATVALQRGMPVTTIQKMLGHTNVATTMIYAEQDQTAVKTEHERCVV